MQLILRLMPSRCRGEQNAMKARTMSTRLEFLGSRADQQDRDRVELAILQFSRYFFRLPCDFGLQYLTNYRIPDFMISDCQLWLVISDCH